MSGVLISETRPRARKQYPCDAFAVFDLHGDTSDLTKEEKDIYDKLRKNKFKIIKGETYIKQVVILKAIWLEKRLH